MTQSLLKKVVIMALHCISLHFLCIEYVSGLQILKHVPDCVDVPTLPVIRGLGQFAEAVTC